MSASFGNPPDRITVLVIGEPFCGKTSLIWSVTAVYKSSAGCADASVLLRRFIQHKSLTKVRTVHTHPPDHTPKARVNQD